MECLLAICASLLLHLCGLRVTSQVLKSPTRAASAAGDRLIGANSLLPDGQIMHTGQLQCLEEVEYTCKL